MKARSLIDLIGQIQSHTLLQHESFRLFSLSAILKISYNDETTINTDIYTSTHLSGYQKNICFLLFKKNGMKDIFIVPVMHEMSASMKSNNFNHACMQRKSYSMQAQGALEKKLVTKNVANCFL